MKYRKPVFMSRATAELDLRHLTLKVEGAQDDNEEDDGKDNTIYMCLYVYK